MRSLIRPAVVLFLFFTVLTGFLYPLAITGIAQAAFGARAPRAASCIRDGKPIGSSLIGQNFSDPKYFWGRPSATIAAAVRRHGFNGGPISGRSIRR